MSADDNPDAAILGLLREDVGGGRLRGRAFAFTAEEIAERLPDFTTAEHPHDERRTQEVPKR